MIYITIKNTSSSFNETMQTLCEFKDNHGASVPIISTELFEIISANKEFLESIIDYERDYLIDYFGYKTLERAYLMKCNSLIVERPQHMWMRVSITIHGWNMAKVKETYDFMSQKYFIHATPTLFNAGTPRPQLSSCYLIGMEDDSIEVNAVRQKRGLVFSTNPLFLFFPVILYNRARLYNCVFGHNYDPVTDVVVLPFGLHHIFVVANNHSLTDARIFIDDCTIN